MIGPHNFKPLTTDPGSLLHMQGQLLCSQCGLTIYFGHQAKEPCPHAPESQPSPILGPSPFPTACQTCKHWDVFVPGYNGKACVRPGGMQQGYACFEKGEGGGLSKEAPRRNCVPKSSPRLGEAEQDDDHAQKLIERYQKCALRIFGLFLGDPLPVSCRAHSYIERLEAILDGGLLEGVGQADEAGLDRELL